MGTRGFATPFCRWPLLYVLGIFHGKMFQIQTSENLTPNHMKHSAAQKIIYLMGNQKDGSG